MGMKIELGSKIHDGAQEWARRSEAGRWEAKRKQLTERPRNAYDFPWLAHALINSFLSASYQLHRDTARFVAKVTK